MSKSLLTIIVVLLSMSFKKADIDFKGDWKIDYLILENDTLYQSGNIHQTIRFYNGRMNDWSKTEDDADYIGKCIHSTFNNLKNVVLTINRNYYSRSIILPCWDHIKHPTIERGKYKIYGNSIELLDTNNTISMKLEFSSSNERITYSNTEFNYQIVFKKLNGI